MMAKKVNQETRCDPVKHESICKIQLNEIRMIVYEVRYRIGQVGSDREV